MEKILIKNFGIVVVMVSAVSLFVGINLPLREACLLCFFLGMLIGVWAITKTLHDISKIRRR